MVATVMLRFLTAGESHGPTLVSVLDGVPAGLKVDVVRINQELHLRQQGYGRGARQKIESDEVEIVGGVRHGTTSGAPLAMLLKNKDWENWKHIMSVESVNRCSDEVLQQLSKKTVSKFRPGHADLSGTLKFRLNDIRDVIERSSARETAARVAAGALCAQLLEQFGIKLASHVVQVGSVKASKLSDQLTIDELDHFLSASQLACADSVAEQSMISLIDSASRSGDSLGGVVEVLADGLPVGLGTYTQWDARLDGQLAQALMSVQAIKAVELGDGIENAGQSGSAVHDPIYPSAGAARLPFKRRSNHAGGLEGGMTNGERLIVRAFMKPIPTLRQGLPSVTYPDFKADTAHFERSDVCAIAAASVVCKAMVSFVLARALLDKFGGDTVADMILSYREYTKHCQQPTSTLGILDATRPPDLKNAADLETEIE